MISLIDDNRLEQWLRQAAYSPGDTFSLTSSATLSYASDQGEYGLRLEVSKNQFGEAWIRKVLQLRYLQPAEYHQCIPLVSPTGHWQLWHPVPQNNSVSQEDMIHQAASCLIELAGLS
ncbi:hypothetical protein [Vibrio mangrovi]|nr:hypothetical protein [Vibrio mangrovi]MDW6001980.1 hypothetical protein [Vibrio mangrovi]